MHNYSLIKKYKVLLAQPTMGHDIKNDVEVGCCVLIPAAFLLQNRKPEGGRWDRAQEVAGGAARQVRHGLRGR